MRYPGGNFVSGYHWRDGVVTTESRFPVTFATLEKHRAEHTFGTCEFVTADQISGGRIEIAVAAGVAPGGPAKPLTHLRDTVHALRASLQDAANPPGWVSTPHILLAGSGDKLLRNGGELADIVGFVGHSPTRVHFRPATSRCSRLQQPTTRSPPSGRVPVTVSIRSSSTSVPRCASPVTGNSCRGSTPDPLLLERG